MTSRKDWKKQQKKIVINHERQKEEKQTNEHQNIVLPRPERHTIRRPSYGNGLTAQPVLPRDRVLGGSKPIVVPPRQNVEYRLGEVEYNELVNVRELGIWYSASAFCFSWCLSFLYDIWKGEFESSNKESNAWVLLFALGAFSLLFLVLGIKLSRKRKDIVGEIEQRYNRARGIDTDQEKDKSIISAIKDFFLDENNDDL